MARKRKRNVKDGKKDRGFFIFLKKMQLPAGFGSQVFGYLGLGVVAFEIKNEKKKKKESKKRKIEAEEKMEVKIKN